MFRDQLAIGQLGESLIAQWLRRRGWNVLPAYEKEIDNGKGPRLFTAECDGRSEQLVSPDLFVMRHKEFRWIEAKHKTHFSWYGIGGYFVTGVDLHHFRDYCKVADRTELPVWLLFLHRESATWDEDIKKRGAPATCPVGLFGQEIAILRQHCSHEHPNHGRTGMIYWQPVKHLRLLARLEDMLRAEV